MTKPPDDRDWFEDAVGDAHDIAALWHERLDDGPLDEHESAAFESWRGADPANAAAFEDVSRAWDGLGAADANPRVRTLRRSALTGPSERRKGLGRALSAAGGLAAGLAIVAAAGFFLAPELFGLEGAPIVAAADAASKDQYVTGVGERSTVLLDDGTSVVLNTASRIAVDLRPDERRVTLLEGQALFEVAHDASRPFIVTAGDRRITALGTAFDVRLEGEGDKVQVTLIEGRVSVDPIQASRASEAAELVPGEQLVAARMERAVKREADVAKVTSWREGRIVFSDDSLAEAVDEVNRYNRATIILEEPSLATLRVSGVFAAGRSASFLETVTGYYPVDIIEQTDTRVVLAWRK